MKINYDECIAQCKHRRMLYKGGKTKPSYTEQDYIMDGRVIDLYKSIKAGNTVSDIELPAFLRKASV